MITILKIPFDKGIIDKERRGASKAPALLAKELQKSLPNLQFVEVPVCEDFTETQESICAAATEALVKGKVIALGGDHSITYGLVRAFRQHYPDSCLVILDAHSDCEDDFIPPSHEGVTRAIATTLLSPKDILLAGYRKARTKEEKEFIKKNKIKTIEPNIKEIEQFIQPYESAYLSIDIDVFDKKDAPGTGWPELNGINRKELLNIIKNLAKNKRFKSFDIAEVSPPKDIKNKTASLAIEIINLILK